MNPSRFRSSSDCDKVIQRLAVDNRYRALKTPWNKIDRSVLKRKGDRIIEEIELPSSGFSFMPAKKSACKRLCITADMLEALPRVSSLLH